MASANTCRQLPRGSAINLRGSRQSLEGASSTRKGIFVAIFACLGKAQRRRVVSFVASFVALFALSRSSLRRSSRLSLVVVFQIVVETTKFATSQMNSKGNHLPTGTVENGHPSRNGWVAGSRIW